MSDIKGTCKHGTFILSEGCPQCIAEAKQGHSHGHESGYQAPADLTKMVDDASAGESEDNWEVEPTYEESAIIRVSPDKNAKVVQIYQESLRMLAFAQARVIETEDDLKPATDDLSLIAGVRKSIEDIRKEYTGPINEHLKAINDAFKEFISPLDQANEITKQKILAFRKKQEEIKAEQERINRLRQEAAQAEMELKGELTESVGVDEVAPEPSKVTRTGLGTSGMADNWKAEVTDFSLLPDEYKLPNMQMLNAAARTYKDKRQIPGVRFYNDPIIKVRAKKTE